MVLEAENVKSVNQTLNYFTFLEIEIKLGLVLELIIELHSRYLTQNVAI